MQKSEYERVHEHAAKRNENPNNVYDGGKVDKSYPLVLKHCFGAWFGTHECSICPESTKCKNTLFVGW